MKTITTCLVTLILCLIFNGANAQEVKNDSIINTESTFKKAQIDRLENEKTFIENQERNYLKAEIETINKRLDAGKITAGEAEELKKEAAKRRAANIEDRLAIIEKKIELVKRNPYNENLEDNSDSDNGMSVSITPNGVLLDLDNKQKSKPPKYDIRTTSKFVFAIGFNNAVESGQSIGDTPYQLAGSGFVEIGGLWQTRLFKESNFARINYGYSFQWNKLNMKEDQFFVQNGDITTLEDFPVNLKQSQIRFTNIVVPVHFEFGPSAKKEYDNRIRFNTYDKFKFGIGGYGGVRLATQQKLRFEENGDNVKQKTRRNFNASNFIYGLSAYVGVGEISLYAKYDLNPLFRNQAVDQNNVSLGVRFDID